MPKDLIFTSQGAVGSNYSLLRTQIKGVEPYQMLHKYIRALLASFIQINIIAFARYRPVLPYI